MELGFLEGKVILSNQPQVFFNKSLATIYENLNYLIIYY